MGLLAHVENIRILALGSAGGHVRLCVFLVRTPLRVLADSVNVHFLEIL